MKFCSQCGNQLNDAAQFCPKCGNQVAAVSNGPQPQTQYVQQPQPAPQPQVQYVQQPQPIPQPQMQYAQPGIPKPVKPNSNMVFAIITTICFCFPAGVYAIILASKVDSLYIAGMYEEAKAKADDAKEWSIIGIVAGIFSAIIYGVLTAQGVI